MNVLPSEQIRAEKTPFFSGRTPLNTRQLNIVNYSFSRMNEAAERFFEGNGGELKIKIAPLVIDTFSTLEKKPVITKKFTDFNEVVDSDIKTIFSFVKNEGFEKVDMGEILAGVISDRFMNIATLKDQGIALMKDNNFQILKGQKKFEKISAEVNKFGLLFTDNFYRKYPLYLEQIGQIENQIGLNALRSKMEKELKNTNEDRYVLQRLKTAVTEKTKSLKTTEMMTKQEKSKQYYTALESGINYLRYCYPQEQIGKLAGLAEISIRQIAKARDGLSELTEIFAASHQMAEIFWQVRLGREIINPEMIGLTKEMIKGYVNSIFDQKLRTESAAFWFEKKTVMMPSYEIQPNLALVRSIESLLEAHKSIYGQKATAPLNIMLLVNDNRSMKFTINPNASPQKIIELIQKTPFTTLDLSLKQKYELKKEAYKPKNRNQAYHEIYDHKKNNKAKIMNWEFNLPFKKRVKGDYIVRLTTNSKLPTGNKNSPFSLFSVDSHKALVDIDLNSGKGIELSVKLSHRDIDGNYGKTFFKTIYAGLNSKHERDLKQRITAPNFHLLNKVKPIEQNQQVFIDWPIMEANASAKYENNYPKITIENHGQQKNLSPNIARAATLALANNTYDAHVLFAANRQPHTEGPYDNIQPVIVSLHPIKQVYDQYKNTGQLTRQQALQVLNWVEKTNEAIDFAKKGLSTTAVLAAPTGRSEKIISAISIILHKGVLLLNESSGMFSPLPDLEKQTQHDGIVFYTANGDAYGTRSDLLKTSSSIGTVGYSQTTVEQDGNVTNEAFYSIRKTPQQSQVAFANFVKGSLLGHDKKKPFKEKNALKALNGLIIDWEDLILGKISLEDYNQTLKHTFRQLTKDNVCGHKNLHNAGISSPQTLQRALNMVFMRDASETINPTKLSAERESFYGFMMAVNQQL